MAARREKPTLPGPPPAADQAVRGRLLRAAAELFTRKGYAATTVGAIVAAAGVTKPTLYYYFRSKEGIFLEIMNEGPGRFLAITEGHRAADALPARERIRALCGEVLALVIENLHVVRLMHGIYYGPPQGAPYVDFDRFHDAFHVTLRALIERGIRRGELRRADPAVVLLAVSGAVSAAIESHLCHPERAVDPETLDRALQFILQGPEDGPPPKRRRP